MNTKNKMTVDEAQDNVCRADERYHHHYQSCGCMVTGFDCERGQEIKGGVYLAQKVLDLVCQGAFVSTAVCFDCGAEEGHYGWCVTLTPPPRAPRSRWEVTARRYGGAGIYGAQAFADDAEGYSS